MKHLGKFNKLVQENFVNNDGFQRFYGISSATLNKHAPCKKKNKLEVTKCLSSIKAYWKQLWQELNYTIFSYKIRVRKIESLKSKETFRVSFKKGHKEIFRNFKWKICHRQ